MHELKNKQFFLIIFTLFLTSFSQITQQKNPITAEEAAKKIGQEVVIKAKVVTVFYAKNSTGKPTFLNLVYPFPNNPIAVIIFEEDLKRLNIDAQLYKGKTILVKGVLRYYKDEEKPYKDKASITIYSKDQLKILNSK